MQKISSYSPWLISGALHLAIGTAIGVMILQQDFGSLNVETVEFEVLEEGPKSIPTPQVIAPKPQPIQEDVTIRDDPTLSEPQSESIEPQEKVFGFSDNAITSDSPGSIAVKKGNTITKAPDNKSLKNGADDLPIPEAEYLVTSMPELISEVRIPYPQIARTEGREGTVILKILIDQMGNVRAAEIIEKAGYGFDELAEKYIYQFRFKPAYIGREPVAVEIRYAVKFKLTL